MSDTASEITAKADFTQVRYAQCWEDADLLVQGLDIGPDDRCLSIASAGDNSFSLLACGPAHVAAIDLNATQIYCTEARRGAYKHLSHSEFLELMGSRPSSQRAALLRQALSDAAAEVRDFWQAKEAEVVRLGLGGAGRFENYFALFRRYVLPMTHGKSTIDELLIPKTPEAREAFFRKRWLNPRWNILTRIFFSRAVMGRLGRDPAFFDQVEGGMAEHVADRIRHAFVELDPSENPYLHWILTGTHGAALPHALRAENFAVIRAGLDRFSTHLMSTEAYAEQCARTGERIDVFNLSNIFEYMNRDYYQATFRGLIGMAAPGARFAYWNMRVPRRASADIEGIEHQAARSVALYAQDKAFFYRDFVLERLD